VEISHLVVYVARRCQATMGGKKYSICRLANKDYRHSFTRWYWLKTNERKITQFSYIVFLIPTIPKTNRVGNSLAVEERPRNMHLYSPERQQQQVKEAPNIQQQKRRKKTTLKAGELVNSVTTFIYLRTLKHLLTRVNIKLR